MSASISVNRLARHYKRALGLWPRDVLRPECELPARILPSVEKRLASPKVSVEKELGQINALYGLLEDRYKTRYPLVGRILEPKSHPGYYTDLLKEIEEVPTRSWFTKFVKRWSGAFRLQ